MDNVRFFLVAALAFLGLLLWQAWEEDYGQQALTNSQSTNAAIPAEPAAMPSAADVPQTDVASVANTEQGLATPPPLPSPNESATSADAADVTVNTDLLDVRISLKGGSIDYVGLKDYPISLDAVDEPTALFYSNPPKIYAYQGGLAGSTALPTHHDVFSSSSTDYTLAADKDQLVVVLSWQGDNGIQIDKRYSFHRGSYEIDIEYDVRNGSSEKLDVHHYDQLKRNEESSRQGMIYTYTGAVLSLPEKPFEKYDLDDLSEQPLKAAAMNGWVGVIQHYFVAALIPSPEQTYHYYSKVLPSNIYLVGALSPAAQLEPGSSHQFRTRLFVGPKRQDIIAKVTDGLELSVDYGMLWFIAKPLFTVLSYLHDLSGNWGWAIILLTIALKLIFYPLSAAGYRSMANMRRVQPRMLALRDRYKDDRAQLNQAMMNLYKEEKINPLGGCFPILVQIPVFIALYWVLLESVEMRQAPFILWINDLSTKDPLFVLPLLMGVSMFLQQKLNPAPLDPIQAKVMQVLPIIFTVFFAFFPSGLVLYWLVNNILSIAQQWKITRAIEENTA